MKTGIELITIERQEQIEKHGWTIEKDSRYKVDTLLTLAKYLMTHQNDAEGDNLSAYLFSDVFGPNFPKNLKIKLDSKSHIERLTVAGALIAAEIDRLNNIQ